MLKIDKPRKRLFYSFGINIHMLNLEKISLSIGAVAALLCNSVWISYQIGSKESVLFQKLDAINTATSETSKKLDIIDTRVDKLDGRFERLDERTKILLDRSKITPNYTTKVPNIPAKIPIPSTFLIPTPPTDESIISDSSSSPYKQGKTIDLIYNFQVAAKSDEKVEDKTNILKKSKF